MRFMVIVKATKDTEAGVMQAGEGDVEIEIRQLFAPEDFGDCA